MKMTKLKKSLVLGLTMAILASSLAFGAEAKTISTKKKVSGTVTSTSSHSFELKTSKHKTYKIEVGSNTKLVNVNGKTIGIGDIKKDNKVKVSGKLSGSDIKSTKVTDKSIG